MSLPASQKFDHPSDKYKLAAFATKQGAVIMSCGENVKVVTNLKPPAETKSNIIPVISWRRAISSPDNPLLRKKV